MKQLIYFFFIWFSGMYLMAEIPPGISHQAIIRNSQGELVSDAPIGIRVSILQGSTEGNTVFIETHEPISNQHGLITYVIGQGTPVSYTFADIDWANGPYFLKTEVDPEGGVFYSISGITQFQSVPYALIAGKSSDNKWEQQESNIYFQGGNLGIGTNNPNALLHTRGMGTGGGNVVFKGSYKLSHGDPPTSGSGTRMMWYPDKSAFRAGTVISTHWHKDSIGVFSFATGYNTIAKGEASMAMGNGTKALGSSSIAMGSSTTALETGSTAMGFSTTASGQYSTAMGYSTIASAFAATALGFSTTASGVYSTAMGTETTASGNHSTAMGYGSIASGFSSTAMGLNARALNNAFAINLSLTIGPEVPTGWFQISGASAIGGNKGWTSWSDKRMKKDVQFLENENSLEKIMKLQGVRFRWKESNPDVVDRYYLGFLAQDVLKVLPEPVLYDELNDIYSMEYSAIIPVLVEAIKEQQATIELLIKRIEALETEK